MACVVIDFITKFGPKNGLRTGGLLMK